MKRGLKTALWTIAGIFLAIVLCCGILALPEVQNSLSGKALAELSGKIPADFSVSSLRVRFPGRIEVSDLLILDPDPCDEQDPQDTVVYIRKAQALLKLNKMLPSSGGIRLESLNLDGVEVYMVSEPAPVEDTLMNNFKRIFSSGEKDEKKKSYSDVFQAMKLKATGVAFHYKSCTASRSESIKRGVDWSDLALYGTIDARRVRFNEAHFSARFDGIDFVESSGYKGFVKGYLRSGSGTLYFSDLKCRDEWSDVNVEEFKIDYVRGINFKFYSRRVPMQGYLLPSRLSARTISALCGVLPQCETDLNIRSARIFGKINDFRIEDLLVREIGSGLSFRLEGECSGLAEKRPRYKMSLSDFNFTTKSLADMMESFSKGSSAGIRDIAPGQTFVLDASVDGDTEKTDLSISLDCGIGSARADLSCRSGFALIGGKVSASSLDVGKIIRSDRIGKCSLDMEGSLSLKDGKIARATIESLDVSSLRALDYTYSGIEGRGVLVGKSFDGKIVSRDPNLSFLFQGQLGFSAKTGDNLFKFVLNLGQANPDALGFTAIPELHRLSGLVSANIRIGRDGRILGDMDIPSLYVQSRSGTSHEFGRISLSAVQIKEKQRIVLDSPFAKARYEGDCTPLEIPKVLCAVTLGRDIPSAGFPWKYASQAFETTLEIGDCSDILSCFAPGYYIASGTRAVASLSGGGEFSAYVTSPRIAKGNQYLKGLDLFAGNLNGSSSVKISGSELHYGAFNLSRCNILCAAWGDAIRLSASYRDSSNDRSTGSLNLSSTISRDAGGSLLLKANPENSRIILDGKPLAFSESEIRIGKSGVQTDSLTISGEEGYAFLAGGIGRGSADTLNVEFNRFDLACLNNFIADGKLDMGGTLFGIAKICTPTEGKIRLNAELISPSLSSGGKPVGELSLSANSLKRSNAIGAYISLIQNGNTSLSGGGNINLDTRTVSAALKLSDFNPDFASLAFGGAVSDISGSISGTIRAGGPLDSPSITSDNLRLSGGHLSIPATGADYSVQGNLAIVENGLLEVGDLTVTDPFGGKAKLVGTLGYGLDADFDNFRILSKKDNGAPYYGNLSANGTAEISLSQKTVSATADIIMAGDGDIHLCIPSDNAAGNSDLLTFRQQILQEDQEEQAFFEKAMRKIKTGSSTLDVKAKVQLSQAQEIFLALDSQGGNVISGRGNGRMTFELKPSEPLQIGGDYTLTEGKYRFSLLNNLTTKDFSIQDGSSIKFAGSIMDSEFDVHAVHSLKASLSALVADTTSVSSRRTVECGIDISDKLKNPSLNFSIEVPDLDPTTKSLVQSALNTYDKVEKQFLSLLVTGSFLPSEQSGVVENTGSNILFQNISAIMASQVNRILQRLDIPLDLGLSYQQNEAGTDIFDVALSTQLFDNRVIVNGSVGNRQFSTHSSEGVVSDVDVEVKMDRQGRLRFKLFSHSQDDYTNYLDNTQRSGVGLAYQREFRSFPDFIRGIFRKKDALPPSEMEPATMKTLIIDE